MACYDPLDAYLVYGEKTENGKAKIVFQRSKAKGMHEAIKLPCGRCIGCRVDKSRDWAIRCYHEASLYDYNCFITLTYDEDNIHRRELVKCLKCSFYQKKGFCADQSLCGPDFQLFMKRLRKKYTGIEKVHKEYPIRFFHCGEYGENFSRPHHHACLFNFDFLDKYLYTEKNGVKLYRSESLEELWPYGFSTIGDVTYDSAAYVARYVVKKINGDKAKVHYAEVDYDTGEITGYRVPEHVTMSRRPGIAKEWFERFGKSDVYSKDYVTLDEKKIKPCRYFDKMYDVACPEDYKRIKKQRLIRSRANALDNVPKRLVAKRKCLMAKMKIKERTYEDD